jgi:hypothetical protein
MTDERIAIRLLVHFGRTEVPLVQVTDARVAADGGFIGAGTRAVDVSSARSFTLASGEQITAAHVLDVLSALCKGE